MERAAFRPSRREIIAAAPLLLGAAALPRPLVQARPAPLRFLVVGDWGRGGAEWQVAVARAMKQVQARHGTSFVVSTGDNFYDEGVSSVADPQWDSSFERIYDEALGPWHAVLGNHDYGGRVEAQIERSHRSHRWKMPYYWHDAVITRPGLPHVHLLFLDTVNWLGRETLWRRLRGSAPDPRLQARQLAWLEARLARSTAPIKLVFGHHGIYSIGRHGGGMRMADLDALLRRHKVTAYVNGHDHCLYHISNRGMHYVCSGAGSQVLPDYSGGRIAGCVIDRLCANRRGEPPAGPRWHAFLRKNPGHADDLQGGFAMFEIGPLSVGFTFYDRFANVRHKALIGASAGM